MIVVEGKSDENFIKEYIKHLSLSINQEIKVLEGDISSKKKRLSEFFKQEKVDNIFLIIDADKKKDTKEYKKKIIEILEKLKIDKKFICDFFKNNVFFFPNNKDEGNLETLINEILVQNFFNECFNNYEDCLKNKEKQKKLPSLNLPPLKAKIYTYDFILGGRGKEEERDYSDKNKYDLTNPSLIPLKDFLQKIISEENEMEVQSL